MRKIREVLRLKWEFKLNRTEITKSCGVKRSTISDYLRRAKKSGLSWPLVENMDETELEQLLFPPRVSTEERFVPDWQKIHHELKKKNVTLILLWDEYKAKYPDGYQYSQFCVLLRKWQQKLNLVMRQEHLAGEKLFVDYCGQTIPIHSRDTGRTHQAQIFVAVLGASNYTFAEATKSQTLPDWIRSHERAFQFFGGVPELVVPDNLKSGVSSACRYDPDINPTYNDLAIHYGTAIMPTRVRKPKDKAKVEAGVLLVERWILARLRNLFFFSLSELNEVIRQLLDDLNQRPFKKLPGSRFSQFEALDKPALKPLPERPFPMAQWKKFKVDKDYHVEVDNHYYSVPHQLVTCRLDICFTERTVECFHKGKRIASHCRSYEKGKNTTLPEHMPDGHRIHLESQSPARVIDQATLIGNNALKLTEMVMENRPHPKRGIRACQGILRLGGKFGNDRLDAACARAIAIGSTDYRSVHSILKNGLEKRPLPNQEEEKNQSILHSNIRGAEYYQSTQAEENQPTC